MIAAILWFSAGLARAQDAAPPPPPVPPLAGAQLEAEVALDVPIPPVPPAPPQVGPPPRVPPVDAGGPIVRADGDLVVPHGLYREPDLTRRTGGWLRAQADRVELNRIVSGILTLVTGGGMLSLGLGGVFFEPFESEADLVLGWSFSGVGAMLLTVGVGLLTFTMPEEDRLVRWQTIARARPLTEPEAADFAGALRAEAEIMRASRRLQAVGGLGIALASIPFFALASTAEDETARDFGLAIGGAYALLGIVSAIVALVIETPYEREWRHYEQGLGPLDTDTMRPLVDTPP